MKEDLVLWLAVGAFLSLAVMVGFALGEASGSQTVPMAVVPRDSTVIIYRTIQLRPPKPDTTIRYVCKETK